MENENKAMEESSVQPQSEKNSETALESNNCMAVISANCKGICSKAKSFWNENRSTVLIVLGAVLLIAASIAFKQYYKKNDVGSAAVKSAVAEFVDSNIQEGIKYEIKDPVKESGLYKVAVTVEKQTVDVYVTKDGKKLFPQVIDLTEVQEEPEAKETPKAAAENKVDVPEVDLYVMSYCPYGLQMERGMLPVVEALGNKIKFNLKFVDYALHGQKEVDENLNQYCIQKNQPEKIDNYLKCFWKDSKAGEKGTASICMKATGINANKIKDCVAGAKKDLNPTEKDFNVNKEDVEKYGVQGSPALVVNGTTISSQRDSASILKAVCSGFSSQPKECEKKLSSEVPGAGFDDQIAAAKTKGAETNSSASCGE